MCLGILSAAGERTPVARIGCNRGGLAPPSRDPSVLLITLDTVRADRLRCYGYSRIETPNIDQLSADGIRFESAYAHVPITLPSHAAILTGTYPMHNGVRDFTSSGLPLGVPTLAEVLRDHGYRTAAFVSSFAVNSMWGLNRGFEVYDEGLGVISGGPRDPFMLVRRGDKTVDRLLEWLGNVGAQPFFAWLHLYDAHSPYRAPEPYRSRYAGRPYNGAIAFDDGQVGRVISRLREMGVYDRTLVVMVSDHGESLGEHGEAEHGFFIYNATLRVPLIIKLPGKTTKARVVSKPVATLDLAPTIAQVSNAKSDSFQGSSLLRWIDQPGVASQEEGIYAESLYPRNSFGWHELRAWITPDWKYIDAPQAELYELKRDPGERSNIIAGNPALAASFRGKLDEFKRKFDAREKSVSEAHLNPEVLEKLRSLGYVGYKATQPRDLPDAKLADPREKIVTFNRILRAADLTRLRKFAQADRLLSGLEEAEPGLYVVAFERAENYLAWQKPEQAVAEFQKALLRNPTFDQAALGLGRAHFLLGRHEPAASAFRLALQLNPRNFLARLALGKLYWRENRPEKAEPEMAAVVQAHPDFAEGHADYGIVLAKLRRYREATLEIQNAIELGYRDAIGYNYLGIAYAELGRPQQAISAYEQAVKLNPGYTAAHLNLAQEYRKRGDRAKAQAHFQKVCELSDELCRQYAPQF